MPRGVLENSGTPIFHVRTSTSALLIFFAAAGPPSRCGPGFALSIKVYWLRMRDDGDESMGQITWSSEISFDIILGLLEDRTPFGNIGKPWSWL